jgi:tol-pal system protein YbgF
LAIPALLVARCRRATRLVKHFAKRRYFAVRASTAYDFGVTFAHYLCLCLCLGPVVGCATPASSLRDDNRRLAQTVTDLRTDRRTQERKLRDLQHQLDEAKGNRAAVLAAEVPVLPVEVAGPAAPPATAASDAARIVGVSDDGTEIVYEGDAAAGRPAVVDREALPSQPRRMSPAPPGARAAPLPLLEVPTTTDRLEVTHRVPRPSALSARAAVRSKSRDREPPGDHDRGGGGGDAANDYRAAVELVKAGKHDDAVVALRAFITSHPRHDYADNAQYWLGEAEYAQKDFPRALTEFRKVIEVYPRGNKVPDALLKVGYCYLALGQGEKARAVLEQIVTLYPKSEPAMLAAKRLETP